MNSFSSPLDLFQLEATTTLTWGEDITLTEREFQYIFIMKFNVLAKDYPELLGISPKAYSNYKRRLIDKFGFNSFHALLALSNYLHAFSLIDKFTPD